MLADIPVKEATSRTNTTKAGNTNDQYLSAVSANGKSMDATNISDSALRIVHFGEVYLTSFEAVMEATIAMRPVGRKRTDVRRGDQ